MKAEARVLDFESNLHETGAEVVSMSIDEKSLSHVMAILTDLYSDTEAAVLREYATNARDANVEAGRGDVAVEISTPSPLAPFVRIRDTGTGLSAADIRDTFSRYGTSTKRATNDAVGMLGVGCKSALTYADSFTVTSTKDGRTISVLVTRDEDGSGSMSIVSDETTPDAENGTEIIVPAKTGNTFAAKAARMFSYWTTAGLPILVDGKTPAAVEGLKLSERILLADARHGDGNVVVMGGVAYPFLDDTEVPEFGTYSDRRRIVAFVDIGEVSFAPSREALQSTKATREVLARIVAEVVRERDAAVLRSVADAPTPAAARAALSEGSLLGFRGDAIYKGRPVVHKLDRTPAKPASVKDGDYWRAPDAKDDARSFLTHGGRYGRVTGERTWTVDLDSLPEDVLVFENYDGKTLTPTKREKLETWRTAESLTGTRTLLVEGKLSETERYWLPVAPRDWAIVAAVKLTKTDASGNVVPKVRGTYSVQLPGERWTTEVPADEIDTTKPLYYVHGNAYAAANHDATRRGIVDTSAASIVALPANRIEKFRRDFPAAVSLDDAARTAAETWRKGLPAEVVRAYAFQSRSRSASRLSGLPAEDFADERLREVIRLASADTKQVRTGLEKFREFHYSLAESVKDLPSEKFLADTYPLLGIDGYGNLTKISGDVILYCNSKFAASIPDAAQSDGNPSGKGGS